MIDDVTCDNNQDGDVRELYTFDRGSRGRKFDRLCDNNQDGDVRELYTFDRGS